MPIEDYNPEVIEAFTRRMAYKDIQLIKKLIIKCSEGADPMLTLEAIGRITSEYIIDEENKE